MDKPRLTKDEFIITSRSDIGKEIHNYRSKKGYSQEQLADLMDISRTTISKIENGKFAISVDYLAKFAWHLDFDVRLLENNGHDI